MKNNKDLGALDIFRLAAAALVVFIHAPAIPALGDTGNLILSGAVARIAVPFFFAVTGMFTDFSSAEKIKKLVKKTTLIYAAATAVYLPYGTYYSSVRQLVFDGSFYHLWYFPALIAGVLIVFLLRKLPLPAAFGISAALYAFGLFGDSYAYLVQGIPAVKTAIDLSAKIFSYTRNGIFFAPLFLLIGNFIGNRLPEPPRRAKRALISAPCLLLSVAALIFERLSLRGITFAPHDNMFISLVPCTAFLLLLLTSIKARPLPALRTISMWIYIIHPIIIDLTIRITEGCNAADGTLSEDARGTISKAAISLVTAAVAAVVLSRGKRAHANSFISSGEKSGNIISARHF